MLKYLMVSSSAMCNIFSPNTEGDKSIKTFYPLLPCYPMVASSFNTIGARLRFDFHRQTQDLGVMSQLC